METTCLYDNCQICSQLLEEDKVKQKIPACLFALMLYTFSNQEEYGTHEMMNKEIEVFHQEELTQSDIY
jgi:hypothetical protein